MTSFTEVKLFNVMRNPLHAGHSIATERLQGSTQLHRQVSLIRKCKKWFLVSVHQSSSVIVDGLWWAFLTSTQHGRTLERAFVVVNSTNMHCHAHLPKIYRKPLYSGHTVLVPMVSALEGFYSNPVCSTMQFKIQLSTIPGYTQINSNF